MAFGDASNNLNDVINALLAFKFDPNVDLDPFGSFVLPTADLDWPDVVMIGQTISGGADLELQDVTLTFSEMHYDSTDARWTGEVGVTAPFAVLFPDLLGEFVVSNVNGDDVSYLVVGDPGDFSFVTPIEVRKLSISDPLDLRDPGFKSTKDLTLVQWEAELDQQVVNQANAGDSLWDILFDNVVIEAGATLSFAPRVPSLVLRFDVDLLLDTELRLLIMVT